MTRFSERYKEYVFAESGDFDDRITELSGGNHYQKRKRIVQILLEFNEPKTLKKGRYTQETTEIGAFMLALRLFDRDQEQPYFLRSDYDTFDHVDLTVAIQMLEGGFAPFLFDIIEYQYIFLSPKEQREFSKRLCDLFRELDTPWIIADGRLVKIDPIQFEMDLKRKTEQLMLELKDADPVFQPAYDELNRAIAFFQHGDYSEAIMNAEKSYESVLKVVLNVARGNSDQLLASFASKVELPKSIKPDGFKSNVLSSLPYIRNQASGHGAGASNVVIGKELANLSINLACSLITFVVGEYKKNGGSSNA